MLEADSAGLAEARAHARPGAASRTICVLGLARSGKSKLVQRLIRSALPAAEGGPELGAGPDAPGGLLGGAHVSAGLRAYSAYVREWGRGYALPVRLLDTEG